MGYSQLVGSRGEASSPALSSHSNRYSSPNPSSITSTPSAQRTTADPRTLSSISSLPPTLPPIPRVASVYHTSTDRPPTLRTQSEAVETYGKRRNDNALNSAAASPILIASPASSAARSPVIEQESMVSSPAGRTASPRSVSYTASPKQNPQSDIQSPKDARSVSLAVPYANTAAAAQPIKGNRPHQAETNVKGVPQHARTSTIIEPSQSKGGKRGLNLLNPVSLLLRRRSSQVPSALQEEAVRTKGMPVPPMDLPDDYDPRIRGSVIHDFSAPRPKKHMSYTPTASQVSQSSESTLPAHSSTTSGNGQNEPSFDQSSVSTNGKGMTGFQEHFDEPHNPESRESAIQAETLANHDFLSRVSWQSQESGALPIFARKSQHLESQRSRNSNDDWKTRLSGPSSRSSKSEISALSRLPTTEELGFNSPVSSATATTQDRSSLPISNDAYTRFSSASTQSGDDRGAATTSSLPHSPEKDESRLDIPKHVKSNASRFSFQLSGQDSIAEEKLLEEKANLRRASAGAAKHTVVSDEDEEDDFFDEDAMYDHDELEDDGVFGQEAHDSRHLGLGITHGSTNSSMPAIYSGQPSSAAYVSDGRLGRDEGISRASSDYGDSDDRPAVASLQHSNMLTLQQVDTRRSRASHDFDDDLYWTDGAIVPVNAEDVSRINEEDFDHPDFLKKDKSTANEFTLSPYAEQNPVAEDFKVGGTFFELQDPATTSTLKDSPMTRDQPKMFSEDLERPGDRPPAPSRQDSTPSKNSLTAYHSALADSVQKAAASGRFGRQTSDATSSSAYSSHSGQHEPLDTQTGANFGPVPRVNPPLNHQSRDSYSGFDFGFNDPRPESRNTQTPSSATFPVYAFSPDDSRLYDDDDFDGDDDIISEANAEALASDDTGFYGQEFGFFAKARPGSADSDTVNGGYFGERGFDMIQRSWSTKEPNLTPITERSEFSARNSYIGGHFSPGGAQMSSPAFAAQLARMSPLALAQLQEQDMSLDQVVRMRNLAFNGNDGARRSESMSSISSAAGYSQGFPPSQRGSWQTAGVGGQFMPKGGVPMGFQYSTDSSGSSNAMSRTHSDLPENQPPLPTVGEHRTYSSSPMAESPIGSPLTRMQDSSLDSPDLDATPRKGFVDSPIQNTAPYQSSPRQTRTHSRTGSGADNVTYKREKDASGNDRWVLERRRTSEGGFLELVGREIVEGGRI